jgi:hypothetical protein
LALEYLEVEQNQEAAVPWAGTQVWPFTKNGILANTPNASGVYALWTGETLVYIGESNDILRRLFDLFGSPRPCIAKYVRLATTPNLRDGDGTRVQIVSFAPDTKANVGQSARTHQ